MIYQKSYKISFEYLYIKIKRTNMINELRELYNKEENLKKLYNITKDMTDEEVNDISLFYCQDNVTPDEFKKIIRKIRIKFKGL